MNKLYVIKQNGLFATVKANHKPVGFVTAKFEGQASSDIEVIDIVDDIDPDTLKIIGKKAVFNQDKFDIKQQTATNKLSAEQATKDSDIAERDAVKAIDVNSMIDNLTKDDLKKVLRWLIKRAG